ncbi:conserved hypothetical protein [Ricinus communis]|uniref:Uncharacterized protein n=1 Tax=Ricinus communis TaxID=3988 RepID=B9S805_RICCO|nr:conserved hypothetical protein [Ricinus communis]
MALAMAELMMSFMRGCDSALALSGGRMGGRSSSNCSSYSISSRYSSYSSGGSSLYSGPTSSCSYSSSPEKLTPEEEIFSFNYFLLALIIFSVVLISFEILSTAQRPIMYPSFRKLLIIQNLFVLLYMSFDSEIIICHCPYQVAVYDAERTFRRDLNRIAEKADTSKASGLHRMLSDTTRLLLKHFDSCISGYASVHQQEKCDPAMEFFDKLSLEERENFDEETLVNVDNKRKEKVSSIKDNELSRGHIVVTILVATYGSSNKLPTINSPVDL